MTRVPSTMVELGTEAPSFKLEDHNPTTDMGTVSLGTFEDAQGYLVMFICAHCPYVKNINEALGEVTQRYMDDGIAVVAIQSNDIDAYPQDGPEKMAEQARTFGFQFPYLLDEDQAVAHAYRAACTPDFFLFDEDRTLVYRGQFDDSRPGNDIEPTGQDLTEAVEALLEGRTIPEDEQRASAGCNIKWRKGNEPAYFG